MGRKYMMIMLLDLEKPPREGLELMAADRIARMEGVGQVTCFHHGYQVDGAPVQHRPPPAPGPVQPPLQTVGDL